MKWQNILLRLRALFCRREMDEELSEELQFHLEMQARKNQVRNLDVAEARRRARLQFGSFERATEACREARGVHLLETLLQDLRYGTRTLLKAPGFTVVAVVTLALGIGANSAIFSAVHSVLLKDLPVREPEKLKLLDWSYAPGWRFPEKFQLHSNGHWETDSAGRPASESFLLQFLKEFRSTKLFSTLYGFSPPSTVNANGAMTVGQLVSGEFFSGLGIQPELGRLIDQQDDDPESAQVVVISHRFWRDHFDSDPNIVGRQLTLNNHPFTIIGVTPKGFFSAQVGVEIDVYASLSAEGELHTLNGPETQEHEIPFHLRPNVWWVQMMGRLAPDISEAQAQTQLTALFRKKLNEIGVTNLDQSGSPRVDVRPGSRGLDELKERFAQPLVVLSWVVAIVLLIACGNVANLLLVRGTNRSREIALRFSLGATKSRVLRQLLTESVLLSLTGGALRLLFAVWINRLLLGLLSPPQTRFILSAQLDGTVIGFSALMAIVASVVFGMFPAMRSGSVELTSALKSGGSSTLAKSQSKLSRGLVSTQVATSILLLMGAGLFARTLSNLRATDLGFDRNNLLLFAVDPELRGYKAQRLKDLLDQMTARLQLVPGVRSVAFVEHPAISGNRDGGRVISDLPAKSTDIVNALYNTVGPAYFDTMDIRLLEGRTFDARDTATSTPVALLNKDLAAKLFGNESPLGHIVHKDRFSIFKGDYQIIGVVSNAKYASLTQPAPTLYMSYKQAPDVLLRWSHFVKRTWANPHRVIADVRRAVAQIDQRLPIYGLITQTEQIDLSLRQERMFADLVSLFGVLALVLACVGLYGVMAYSVSRRTQEIGIRVALGADRAVVSAMVLREGMLVVLLGVGIGIPAAIALSRFIRSLLWNVQPFDPTTLAGAAIVMCAVALFAVAVPAYRATCIDPMQALKCE
ncbi:MAG TPA: ABC transporter permease [Terriglobales bacterium]|nr:ABC transporter permease [Terriglobales bacterium]